MVEKVYATYNEVSRWSAKASLVAQAEKCIEVHVNVY
jgi:hypothetical protein